MMLEQIAKHGWEYTYGPIFAYIDTIFPPETWVKYDDELRKVAEPIIGPEVTLELAGIVEVARGIGHNVTMSELEFFQIFYEILMQCTGIQYSPKMRQATCCTAGTWTSACRWKT